MKNEGNLVLMIYKGCFFFVGLKEGEADQKWNANITILIKMKKKQQGTKEIGYNFTMIYSDVENKQCAVVGVTFIKTTRMQDKKTRQITTLKQVREHY